MAENGSLQPYSHTVGRVVLPPTSEGGDRRIQRYGLEIYDLCGAVDYALEACRSVKLLLCAIRLDVGSACEFFVKKFVNEQATLSTSLRRPPYEIGHLLSPVATPFHIPNSPPLSGWERMDSAHLAAQEMHDCLKDYFWEITHCWPFLKDVGPSMRLEKDLWRKIREDLDAYFDMDFDALEEAIRIEWTAAVKRCQSSMIDYFMGNFDSPIQPNLCPENAERKAGDVETEGDVWQFVRSGDVYDIAGCGERGHFRSIRGFEYIEKLLSQAGKPVLMLDLISESSVQPKRFDTDENAAESSHKLLGGRQEPILDSTAKAKYGRRLTEIYEELDEAERAEDEVKANYLRTEKDEIAHEIAAAAGFHGRDRDLNSELNKARSSILNNLRRAYEKMREAKPPLANLAAHFRLSIRSCGDSFIYEPAPLQNWSLSQKS